jgi:putative tryptophan/tyrosine transport system substrate-binding protein
MLDLRRRQFITLLGGAAAAWPLAAHAQQTGRMRRIAMLVGATENDPEAPLSSEAFRQTLNQLGWKEGVSVRIDTRWGAGDPDRMHAYAKELIDFCTGRGRGRQHTGRVGAAAGEPDHTDLG